MSKRLAAAVAIATFVVSAVLASAPAFARDTQWPCKDCLVAHR